MERLVCSQREGDLLKISGSEFRHLKALRLRKGEQLEVYCENKLYLAVISHIGKDYVICHTIEELDFIAFGGIMSGFLGLFFFFKAVKEGHVSVVAPIASTSPLWGSLVAFLFLGEPFSWLRLFGILLVVCGIVLISISSGK